MKVAVKLFAAARELAGQGEVAVELRSGATIEQLRTELAMQHAELLPLLPHALFAINSVYCNNDDKIPENAEVAFIPPVSGG